MDSTPSDVVGAAATTTTTTIELTAQAPASLPAIAPVQVSTTIAPVSAPHDLKKTSRKIQATKDLSESALAWMSTRYNVDGTTVGDGDGDEDGWISQNTRHRIFSLLTISATLYCIVTACLLSVFVPQLCEPNDNDRVIALVYAEVTNTTMVPPRGHECTIAENFINLTPYNVVVLAFNFITLFWFVAGGFIGDIVREFWAISNFDEDPDKPQTNLTTEIVAFPQASAKLKRINLIYMINCFALLLIVIINTILSGILVFRDYYLNERTVLIMISFVTAVFGGIYKRASIAYRCWKLNRCISTLITVNIEYNAMDERKYGHITVPPAAGTAPHLHHTAAGTAV